MRADPFSDAFGFLTDTDRVWLTVAFWLLLIGSAWFARLAWMRDPTQRTGYNVTKWLLRVLAGCMWWQQSLWKVPPSYGPLNDWFQKEVDHAAFALQSAVVRDFVMPNLNFFAPLVYAVEVSVAASLILGCFTRAGATIGALFAIQLWLGIYNVDGEWPWTYFFLIIINVLFVLDPPGRSLGADAVLRRRTGDSRLLWGFT